MGSKITKNKEQRTKKDNKFLHFVTCYLLLIISLFLLIPSLYAQQGPDIVSRAAVVIDAATGTCVYAKNADEEIPPASLTKLMTMHLVMNQVAAGRASFDETVPLSRESWAINQPPRSSLMFLGPGQTVTLREIMLGLAVSSGNDAAVAAALAFAPTVPDFVSMMNGEARRMGLEKTRFVEPAGISENNITCAADFAFFCRAYLALHPESTANFHSVPEFSYPTAANVADAYRDNPRTITQSNRNNMLKTFPGVDGLKTGYIDEAGYNIALTAERQGSRFIAVILGAPARPGGERIRDDDGRRLLSWAFDNFKTVRPQIAELEPARLWKGKEKKVWLKMARSDPWLAESDTFTAVKSRAGALWYSVEIAQPLIAPLPAGAPCGWLIISDEMGELHRVQLLSAQAYERGNVFVRLWHSIRLLFYKPC